MKVQLVAYTPDAERLVAAAARQCYSGSDMDELSKALTPARVAEVIAMLCRAGHLSPLEHAAFTYYIEGVSRVATHQLVRHRIASYSQQSQRYVRVAADFVVPPSIRQADAALAVYTEAMQAGEAAYRRLIELGIAQEDARYCLPQGVASRLVVTMNARELLHLFRLRTCRRTQWEMRLMALLMLREARRVAPAIFGGAGPDCVQDGTCRQGKYSCGRWRGATAPGGKAPGSD